MRSISVVFAALALCGCLAGPAPQGGNVFVDGDGTGGMGSANFQRCVGQCDEGNAGSGPICRDGCMMQEAEDTKDTSWCDGLANLQTKPSCYGTVAKAAGDIKICDRLTDQTDRNWCVSTFGGPSSG
ncbi:MAG: hypothetical protein AB1324_07200 [Candidatus Micrarchaeota archaeon]